MGSKKPVAKDKKQETKGKKQETTAVAEVMPDYMKEFLNQNKADTGALVMSSISVPRLSYRGKRWRFIVDGEETLVKDLTVNVVIVGVEPTMGRFIKTYYAKTYAAGDNAPPDCSSSNGVNPDLWVTAPQSQRCNTCPKNVFGSATSRTGGKSKACHDSKRLWVVRADEFEDDSNQTVVYGLNVPVMSLKNLAEYGKFIARNNYPLALVVTELSMDDESEFPKLCFKHVGFVGEDDVKVAIELNKQRPWSSMEVPMLSEPAPTLALTQAVNTSPITDVVRKEGAVSIDNIIGDWQGDK